MSVLYLESVWGSFTNFSKRLLKRAKKTFKQCYGYDGIRFHQCQVNEMLSQEVLFPSTFFTTHIITIR